MAHEIETHTDADGNVQAAAVFARIPAWHRLGTVFDRDLTAADVLTEGKLGGWNVRKEQAQTVSGLLIPGQYGTVRDNPFTGQPEATGGVVGDIYKPIQNEDTLDLLSAIVDETHARFETAGSLRDGRNVFVTMKLPEGMLIGGVDPVDRYLTLLNSHDGTSTLRLLDTNVRVVCANTMNAALAHHKSQVKIWHTENASKSIQEVRDGLKITFAYDEAFEAEAEKMIQSSLTEAQFVKKVRLVWPKVTQADATQNKRAQTIQVNREAKLIDLFQHSDTNTEIRGTAWAGYQAVTEYLDWFTPIGEKRDADKIRARRTVGGGTFPAVTQAKELAFAKFRVG